MWTKIRIALAAALLLSTASAAFADRLDDLDERGGGYVVPGSLDGVNPALHPGIFGNPVVARSYGFYRGTPWHVRQDWRWGGYGYR